MSVTEENPALFTSKSQLWQTPESILDLVRQVGPIMLDPCTTADNPTNALTFYTPANDGLSKPWAKQGVNYVNQPYNECDKWVIKAVAESARSCEIIMLIPARTDTKYYQDWIFPTARSICFIKGRLKFVDPTLETKKNQPAPFPSALIYWGDKQGQITFDRVMSSIGKILHPRSMP